MGSVVGMADPWEIYSAVMSTAAVGLILLEWTYVITRWSLAKAFLATKFEGPLTSALIRAAQNLRVGRGKQPTVVETVAQLASEGPGPAPQGAAPTPTVGADILADPRAKEYIRGLAGQLGMSEEQVTSMARDFLGGGSLPLPQGGAQGAAGPRGGASAFAPLIQGVIKGEIDPKTALASAVPLFLANYRPGAARQGQQETTGGYW